MTSATKEAADTKPIVDSDLRTNVSAVRPRLVCVTGATGFLGRRLVARLLNEPGLQVRCLLRPTSDAESLQKNLSNDQQQRMEIVRGEFSDAAFLADALAGCGVIYHCAASLEGNTAAQLTNAVKPTQHLIAASAAARAARFVLVSSLGVYGTQTLSRWQQVDEGSPIDPQPELRDPYTYCKVQQEQVTRELCAQLRLPLVVVRPGVIYGEGRSLLTSRVGLHMGPLLVRMGGSHPLPYTYVENCAEGLKQAGLVPGIEGETFNLVDDDLVTGHQLMRFLRGQGKRIRSVWVPGFCIQPLSWLYATCMKWTRGESSPVITPYRSAAIWKPLRYCNSYAKHKLNWVQPISTEQALKRPIVG